MLKNAFLLQEQSYYEMWIDDIEQQSYLSGWVAGRRAAKRVGWWYCACFLVGLITGALLL
jgi:hypothetical protein